MSGACLRGHGKERETRQRRSHRGKWRQGAKERFKGCKEKRRERDYTKRCASAERVASAARKVLEVAHDVSAEGELHRPSIDPNGKAAECPRWTVI